MSLIMALVGDQVNIGCAKARFRGGPVRPHDRRRNPYLICFSRTRRVRAVGHVPSAFLRLVEPRRVESMLRGTPTRKADRRR